MDSINDINDAEQPYKPQNFPVFSIYLDEGVRTIFAVNMLLFARMAFDRAEIIKNYNSLLAMHLSGEAKDQKLMIEKHESVLLDSVIDAVRIGICFENYFKVKLLLADVFIHSVDQNRNKPTWKTQFGEPIFVNSIISGRPAKDKVEADDFLLQLNNLLKTQTINYSTILDVQGYVDILQVPAESIKFLKKQNDARNDLHMMTGQQIWFGDEIFSQYEKLVKIVWGDMARLQNSLLDMITPDSKSRVPVLY